MPAGVPRAARITVLLLAAAGTAVLIVLLPTQLSSTRQAAVTTKPKPTYAQLVEANYKILTRKQTARLLQFASDFRSCMHGHGVDLGSPRPLITRIELALPANVDRHKVGKVGLACGEALGGPPANSSLQTFRRVDDDNAIVLYLPRRCLLDPRVVGRGAGS